MAPAAAQSEPDAVERCAALADKDAEIACLRAALEGRTAPEEEGRDATPLPPAPAAAPALQPANPAPLAEAARPAGLGAEQVARAEPAPAAPRAPEPRELIAAAVTDHRTDARGHLVMQLDNGQIWRQVETIGVAVQLADGGTQARAIPVKITRSGFGGYRMDIPEIGRRIAVSRLR
jgi:hypothetical protein